MNVRVNVVLAIVVVALIKVALAAGLVPAPLAAAAGVFGEGIQGWVIDEVGPEKVSLYMADQAVAAAYAEEKRLLEITAAKRVDAALTQEKLVGMQTEEQQLRVSLARVAPMLGGNQTLTLTGGELWTPARLREFAARQVARHQELVAQITVVEETANLYASAATRAEAALDALRRDLATVEAKRDLLAALVAQDTVIQAQSALDVNVGVDLSQTRQDIQTLIDSQRRANRIQEEMQKLSVPTTASPLVDEQDQTLLDYISSVTGLTVGQ